MEVELKARVINNNDLLEKLKTLGCTFSKPFRQEDSVWVKRTGTPEHYLSNDSFMRIRIQQDGKVIMTAKQSGSRINGDPLVKREHEVVIDSSEEGKKIFALLGLTEAVHVIKYRSIAHLGDIEICLDNVDGLGSFIECEKIVSEDDVEDAQETLHALFTKLSIQESDIVRKGYDVLWLEKYGNKKNLGNYAFIDGQNLYMGTTKTEIDPWKIDLKRFRAYLYQKYNVSKAFYFLGYLDEKNKMLYEEIQAAGFIIFFRKHTIEMLGKKKGNVDADIIFTIMEKIHYDNTFSKIVLVSGDGDYKLLVDFLIQKQRLEKVLFPDSARASSLYKKIGAPFFAGLDNPGTREKIMKKKRAP